MPKIRPRLVAICLGVGVLVLVLGLLAISSWVQGYLRSEDFRRLVSEKTGDAFRAEAEFGPLRWVGSSVFSDTLTASGNLGSVVQSIRADQVRATVNWRAVFSGAWRVDRVEALQFDGVFRPGSPAGGQESEDRVAAATGLAAWLPTRFELGELQVAKARLAFLGADGQPVVTLADSTVGVKPSGAGWAIDGKGGTVTLAHLPELMVTSFRSRLQGATFFLTDAAFRIGDAGKIEASGEFADTSKLRLAWSGVNVAPFLDEEWRSRLSGTAAGTADMTWPTAGPTAGSATGKLRLTDALLQNLGTLDQIATFTGAPQFRRMPVQEISADYRWLAGNLTLTNIVVESKGLMRLEGQCTVAADRTVNGQFRVGVTPQTLQWLPGSRERVFTAAQNGYLWTNLRVGGTLDQLQEDLSSRLAAAMKEEVIQTGVKTMENLPGAARDGVKDVLDILSPLVR
jgi:hypothetical protein